MKATELKIDNILLLDDNKIVRVLWFKLEVACIMEVGVEYPSAIVSLDRLKPITLTEEWLLKFGFENNNGFWSLKNIDILDFKLNKDYIIIFNENPANSGISGRKLIKYVHQLQNLYFALTGEELKQ